MSQPRQAPIHSSSPTKSSLRRPGSIGGPPQQTQTPARSLLPSPHFEDDPIVASHQSSRLRVPLGGDAGIEYSEHALGDEGEESFEQSTDNLEHGHEPPVLPSTFQPFFTLIEDSVSNEHYHPTVHYIFEDDDSDIIAEAACRSLETLDPSQLPTGSPAQSQAHPEDALSQSRLPSTGAGVHEHYLILDVHSRLSPLQPASHQASVGGSSPGTGAVTSVNSFGVTGASSLSAEWQVLQTKVTAAPTIGDGDGEDDEGLMLRIEGRGNTPPDGASEKDREKDGTKLSMEEMIDRFQRRMDEIKQVLETGLEEE